MSFFSLFILLSWVSMMPYPCAAQAHDRELYFPSYYFFAKRRLINHTIKTLLVKSLDDCEYLCYLEDACVSLNIKNPYPNRTHECELNNSTHMEDDGHLVNNPLYYYRGAKNNCGKGRWLCVNNSTCQSGFTDKGYRCVCTPAYQGEHCEKDVDECSAAKHKCPTNADCVNTHGSYNCTCKSGYTGDGVNCTDVDECTTAKNKCSANADCVNTQGSYNCTCKSKYTGDGFNCELDVCQNYKTLSDAERKETHKTVDGKAQCDDKLNGWYRFQGDAGTKMATTCPPGNRCGGSFPGWLKNGHPTVDEGIVTRKVCFRTSGGCYEDPETIHLKSCGSYYVYQLHGTQGCPKRYCGTD